MKKKMGLLPGELRVMNLIWDKGPIRVGELAAQLFAEAGWSEDTACTITTRLIEKGFIRRTEPGFVCEPTFTRKEARRRWIRSLLDSIFGISLKQLFAQMLSEPTVTDEEMTELRRMLEEAVARWDREGAMAQDKREEGK